MDKYLVRWIFTGMVPALGACSNETVANRSWQELDVAADNPAINQAIENNHDGLFAQIKETGSARVIVGFAIQAAGAGVPDQVEKAVRDLTVELAGTQYRILRQYSTLPMLLLEVDQAGLERLLVSPVVNSLHADSLSHTMERPGGE